jgi:hypothetical protein
LDYSPSPSAFICSLLRNLRPHAAATEFPLDEVAVGQGGGEAVDVGHLNRRISNKEYRMSKWAQSDFIIPYSLLVIRYSLPSFAFNSSNPLNTKWTSPMSYRSDVVDAWPPLDDPNSLPPVPAA